MSMGAAVEEVFLTVFSDTISAEAEYRIAD